MQTDRQKFACSVICRFLHYAPKGNVAETGFRFDWGGSFDPALIESDFL
jgi:hypothetical protein